MRRCEHHKIKTALTAPAGALMRFTISLLCAQAIAFAVHVCSSELSAIYIRSRFNMHHC